MIDTRLYQRFVGDKGFCRLERDGKRSEAKVINFGAGGALIDKTDVSVGDTFQCELVLAGCEPIKTEVTVIRKQERSVAIKYDLTTEQQQMLRNAKA